MFSSRVDSLITIGERHWRKLAATFEKTNQQIHFCLSGNAFSCRVPIFVWVLTNTMLSLCRKCKMVISWLSVNCQNTGSSPATVPSNQSLLSVSVSGQVESSKLESSLVAKTNVQASQPPGWPHCLENMCSSFQVKMERIEEERQGEGEAQRLQQDEEEKAEKV